MAHHVRRCLLALGVVAAAGGGTVTLLGTPGEASSLPPIRHVWVAVLENEAEARAFANTTSYLSTLAKQGAFITNYYGIGHQSLDNYVAMISGQGPTPQTQGDCQVYEDITPATAADHNQPQGDGCVYPSQYLTIADQLSATHRSWKGYMEDLGFDDANHGDDKITCKKPNPAFADPTQSAEANDQYAARHDPFMYFHSIIDSPACASNVVALQSPETGLLHDLASIGTTPNFSFISPNLCNDGHDAPCKGADVAGDKTGGLTSIDHWLHAYVPEILASPAYLQDGMLVITFDEAATDSSSQDASFCCSEPSTANGTPAGGYGFGGGQVGAIVLSPFISPGTKPKDSYNHYSLLRTVEDVFHFSGGDDGAGHLGEAATWSKTGTGGNGNAYTIASFGDDVFTNPDYTPPPLSVSVGPAVPSVAGPGTPPPVTQGAGENPTAGDVASGPAGTTPAGTPAAATAAPSAAPGRRWSPHFVATTPSGGAVGTYALVLLPLLTLGVAAGLVSRRRPGSA